MEKEQSDVNESAQNSRRSNHALLIFLVAVFVLGLAGYYAVKHFYRKPLADAMRDPSAVMFRSESFSANPKYRFLCGEFNSKNGFGAYTGYQRFISNYGGYFYESGEERANHLATWDEVRIQMKISSFKTLHHLGNEAQEPSEYKDAAKYFGFIWKLVCEDSLAVDDFETIEVQPVKPVASQERSGEVVYLAVCSLCHDGGLMDAPKLGDKNAWKARIAQGYETLSSHAINGLNVMPAKGGNPELTDEEVKNAVKYMANQSGANF